MILGALERAIREQEERLLRFIARPRGDGELGDRAAGDEFGDLAHRSFRLQCESIADYGAYARHLGRDPDRVRDWRDIPPAPCSAFKSHDLSGAAPGAGVEFETSGTTISRPGRVRLGSTRLYEASLLESFTHHVLPDGARLDALVFGPARGEAPRSSLWFMVDRVAAARCSRAAYVMERGEPRWDRADAELARAAETGAPLLLLGTTLLFHAYLERCGREGLRFTLPTGSRAMDTGGAKGMNVDLGREEIEAAFERVLAIPPDHVVNEYGMAEMGSQFYEDGLLAVHEGRPRRAGKEVPPWVRTRVLDPESLREVGAGSEEGSGARGAAAGAGSDARGVLVHYDLANLEVPLAIQTEDVGTRRRGRLFLEGRLTEAERRGCSLAFEQFLERERVEGP